MFFYMDMGFPTENDVPDFGSIRMYYIGEPTLGYTNYGTNIKLRGYTLLSKDIAKLNLITNAADGSQALVVDTGKTYILCDHQWREWTGSINAGTTIKWNNILE